MSKTQTRGNCPCCGSDQAVVRGTMSKHGYTVENGWFEGVCSGQKYAPMQVERKVTDQIVRDIREAADVLDATAADYRAGRLFPETVRKSDMAKDRKVFIPFADASPSRQAAAVAAAAARCESRARAGRGFASDLEKLVNEVHGQPLRVVVIDEAGIQVGDQVKVWGEVVTVTKIADAQAWGAGPHYNGRTVPHVFWLGADGKERSQIKALVRKVQP